MESLSNYDKPGWMLGLNEDENHTYLKYFISFTMTPGWRSFLSITDNFITIITTIQNHRQQLAQQHLYHQLSSNIWDLGLSEPKRRLKREVLTVVETDWYPMFGDSLPRAACSIGYSSAFGANMGYQWTYNIAHVCIVCPFHFFAGMQLLIHCQRLRESHKSTNVLPILQGYYDGRLGTRG